MLRLEGLTAAYGPVVALDDVSLEVAESEIATVLGANGAGKTTLLRTLSGLVRPTSGTVVFEGRDITAAAPHVIVREGLVQVPEGRMVVTKLSVLDNLLAAAAVRRDRPGARRDLERVMDRFPVLRERARQLAGTLSGGQQQMLVIARALMARPKLLLLDEPSLGLAPRVTAQIMGLLRDLRERTGLTVVLVEQNARSALSVADRAIVLALGRVVASDETLDDQLRHAYLGF